MAESLAWRDLGIRVGSAAILAPLGLLVIWLGGLVWVGWLAILVAGMAIEWVGLCRLTGAWGVPLALGLWLCGLGAVVSLPMAGLAALPILAVLLGVASRRAPLGVGILYLGPALLALLMLRHGAAGLRNVLFVMVVVSAGDIGAYLVGRFVGGPRLAPQISPGKTWSGAAGGVLAAVLAGAALGSEHMVRAGLIAFWLSVVAQAGDLLESAVKRHFGAKDSGSIIPGHGGLLDRLDGVLAAAPAALLWSMWVGTDRVLWY